jgi:hypothetical protein
LPKREHLRSSRKRSASFSTAAILTFNLDRYQDDEFFCGDQISSRALKEAEKQRKKTPKSKPQKRKKEPSPPQEEIYCVCRTADDGTRPMINCDKCEDWFHFDCVGVPFMTEE